MPLRRCWLDWLSRAEFGVEVAGPCSACALTCTGTPLAVRSSVVTALPEELGSMEGSRDWPCQGLRGLWELSRASSTRDCRSRPLGLGTARVHSLVSSRGMRLRCAAMRCAASKTSSGSGVESFQRSACADECSRRHDLLSGAGGVHFISGSGILGLAFLLAFFWPQSRHIPNWRPTARTNTAFGLAEQHSGERESDHAVGRNAIAGSFRNLAVERLCRRCRTLLPKTLCSSRDAEFRRARAVAKFRRSCGSASSHRDLSFDAEPLGYQSSFQPAHFRHMQLASAGGLGSSSVVALHSAVQPVLSSGLDLPVSTYGVHGVEMKNSNNVWLGATCRADSNPHERIVALASLRRHHRVITLPFPTAYGASPHCVAKDERVAWVGAAVVVGMLPMLPSTLVLAGMEERRGGGGPAEMKSTPDAPLWNGIDTGPSHFSFFFFERRNSSDSLERLNLLLTKSSYCTPPTRQRCVTPVCRPCFSLAGLCCDAIASHSRGRWLHGCRHSAVLTTPSEIASAAPGSLGLSFAVSANVVSLASPRLASPRLARRRPAPLADGCLPSARRQAAVVQPSAPRSQLPRSLASAVVVCCRRLLPSWSPLPPFGPQATGAPGCAKTLLLPCLSLPLYPSLPAPLFRPELARSLPTAPLSLLPQPLLHPFLIPSSHHLPLLHLLFPARLRTSRSTASIHQPHRSLGRSSSNRIYTSSLSTSRGSRPHAALWHAFSPS
ncbi:hypothetical protein L1887_60846 [Cichorium endivia]|nr:hypothetical protein L1887_60846 [Cichorium endivia]